MNNLKLTTGESLTCFSCQHCMLEYESLDNGYTFPLLSCLKGQWHDNPFPGMDFSVDLWKDCKEYDPAKFGNTRFQLGVKILDNDGVELPF